MRAFWPCIDRKGTTTFKAQRGSKDIIKIVHVSFVVQLKFHEAMRIFFVYKENKNNFIQQFLLFRVFVAEPLMSHGLFYRCPYYLSGPWTW